MHPVIVNSAMGFLGGVTRACVGAVKSLRRKSRFRPVYFLFTLVLSGIIGVFCGLLFGENYKFSLVAGYAGTDLIESLYSIKKKRPMFI